MSQVDWRVGSPSLTRNTPVSSRYSFVRKRARKRTRRSALSVSTCHGSTIAGGGSVREKAAAPKSSRWTEAVVKVDARRISERSRPSSLAITATPARTRSAYSPGSSSSRASISRVRAMGRPSASVSAVVTTKVYSVAGSRGTDGRATIENSSSRKNSSLGCSK